jgi:hypothetical protein
MDLQKQTLVGPFEFDQQHQISQTVWTAFCQEAMYQLYANTTTKLLEILTRARVEASLLLDGRLQKK